jgi:hypothetical protein
MKAATPKQAIANAGKCRPFRQSALPAKIVTNTMAASDKA